MDNKQKELDKYEVHENCLKCGKSLALVKGWKYCSQRCSKLYLKAAYKRRNKEKVAAYNESYRALAPDKYFVRGKDRKKLFELMPNCQKCNTTENLQACHIKPHWAGGSNKLTNFIILCQVCHYNFDFQMRGFWNKPADQLAIVSAKNVVSDI